jgi:hypothetical protein
LNDSAAEASELSSAAFSASSFSLDHNTIGFTVEIGNGLDHFRAHRFIGAARSTADKIGESTHAFVADFCGQIVVAGLHGKAGEFAGNRNRGGRRSHDAEWL